MNLEPWKPRLLDALERTVKQFKTREALYPLRIPVEPLPFERVIRGELGDERRRVDPRALRSRVLLQMTWDEGSAWELWVIVLPSGLKLYCDSGEEGHRLLASGGRNAGEASDRLFLELLAESGGEHFGLEMSGGAPSRVYAAIDDREFLIDVFTNLLEGAGLERFAAAQQQDQTDIAAVGPGGYDFRDSVGQWLEQVLDPDVRRWPPSSSAS